MAATKSKQKQPMKPATSPGAQNLSGGRWPLIVGGVLLLVGAYALMSLNDKNDPKTAKNFVTVSSTSQPGPGQIPNEVPPWKAARQQAPGALPSGAVPVSQINPPPPDPNEQAWPTPHEPPNPATHRPDTP